MLRSLEGIKNGKLLPSEIVLIEMDTEKSQIPVLPLPINHILLKLTKFNSLPIAEARNLGAFRSRFETLAFLDVDCIPSKNYIHSIATFSLDENSLYMGEPRYLTKNVSHYEEDFLKLSSTIHPHRPNQEVVTKTDDYGMFWSLTFFLRQNTFSKIGGFDCNYSGYGAEDTDFAFKARDLNIDFILTPFKVYHQQHAFCRPPLNSLESIINNCNYFFSKWAHWPMANYLEDFSNRNLIQWSEAQNHAIEILNKPSQSDIENALVLDEAYA